MLCSFFSTNIPIVAHACSGYIGIHGDHEKVGIESTESFRLMDPISENIQVDSFRPF